MNKLALIAFLAIGTDAFAQPNARIAKSPAAFVPAGYVVFEKVLGDLNGDNQDDYVFVIKGTDKGKVVKDQYRGELDRNPRGLIIALSGKDGYALALDRRNCFSSENEDGGVYFAPDLGVSVEKGSLRVHYAHGRYGYWTYSFRYLNADFQLVGFDSSENRGPVVEHETSINLLTKRVRTRHNVNARAEGGDEKFKETWKTFALSKPIKLREIDAFDDFDLQGILRLRAP